MDPQIKSLLTSFASAVSTAVAAAAATHGVINAAQQSALSDILVTAAGFVVTGLLTWYKKRQQSPTALIQAVNAGDNGVKVVAASEPVRTVNVPLKGE